jgi:hypothetical protein
VRGREGPVGVALRVAHLPVVPALREAVAVICVRCFSAANRLRLLALAAALAGRTARPDEDLDGVCLPAVGQLHGESLCTGHLALELARTLGTGVS